MSHWFDEQSGRTTCLQHGGNYLRYAVAASPRKRTHITPLDVWHKMGPGDLAFLRNEGIPACENCPK